MNDTQNFTQLSQWLAWLEQAHPIHNIELGHERIKQVAKTLGLLTAQVPVVTVGGTNGKGSVVACLEALSNSHQLKIGSYTSPHLIEFNERIKINGQPASDQVLMDAFAVIAQAQQDTPLTYFEFTTLVGLYIFQQADLDLIVLEVGLGGRLDAVNILDADISVITSIGLDHTDWLGDTLEKIAHEKAGIMRHNQLAIIADPNIYSLLQDDLKHIQPQVSLAQADYYYQVSDDKWSFSVGDIRLTDLPLTDLYVSNVAAALRAFSALFAHKVVLDKVKNALQDIEFIGRFQKLSQQPLIIVDVAHNPDSARLLNDKLLNLKAKQQLHISAICGMLKDKDVKRSLQQMSAIDDWLLIDLPEPRGAKGQYLLDIISEWQGAKQDNAKSYSQLVEAWQDYWQDTELNKNSQSNTAEQCKREQALIVFGSFVTVGKMLEYWNKFHKTNKSL
ncbi:MAG: bifunctional tetrahydrofolate synthase/dihydrofolate synthase [Kangiellaceae bacterium]|nr:bifunctional tetrahydrofolate synthase/dihydrofolate synthase [Kangiellaceae bacterium]